MGACDLKSVTDVWGCVQESMELHTWPAGADKQSVQQKSCGFKSSEFKLKLLSSSVFTFEHLQNTWWNLILHEAHMDSSFEHT